VARHLRDLRLDAGAVARRTDIEVEDPLSFFLLGVPKFEATPSRPAWQRFYTLTTGAPFHLKWSFETAPCETCQTTATVRTRIASPAW
jgi:hypothetical protein